MFRKIRITILLFILFLVGANAYLTHERTTDWDQSLSIVIYPINADGSPFTADYITRLTKDDFTPVEHFMQKEGLRYNLSLVDPVLLDMAPEISTLPPAASLWRPCLYNHAVESAAAVLGLENRHLPGTTYRYSGLCALL